MNYVYLRTMIYFRIVKSIIEHEEMKGLFGSICKDFQQSYPLKFLDTSDLPKLRSGKQGTIHFVTEGKRIYLLMLLKYTRPQGNVVWSNYTVVGLVTVVGPMR